MIIFQLEKPILDKIEKVVDQYFTDAALAVTPNVTYLDFEPDDGYIHDNEADGAICVYARIINFPEGSASNTGTQDSRATLIVDSYGFGDPLLDTEDITKYLATVRNAQNRAQIFNTLSYKAIMDRAEVAGLPNAVPPVLKTYGTGIDVLEKGPLSMTKFSPQGSMDSRKGVCLYRSEYYFKLAEEVPAEALGVPYVGSDNIESQTYNPGSQPES